MMPITQLLACRAHALDDLWVALCLLLVIEGMMPFLYPEKWQAWLRQVVETIPRCSGGLASP